MTDVKSYKEYTELYNSKLIKILRRILKRLEDNNGYDIEDSDEHGAIIEYFNENGLHKKLTVEQFKQRQKDGN